MKLNELIKLDYNEVMSLREKATLGDPEALKDYALYGVWKVIDSKKASRRAKLRVFVHLSSQVKVTWQTTSN